jgi:outer membrane receptor protein involved in Fe transport
MKKAAAIGLLILSSSIGALAQSAAGMGAISGKVRDASGASIPGAQVVVTNESRGVRRTMETTDAGVFLAPSLVPAGGYVVTVTKEGFSLYEVKDVQVQVGQNVDLAVVMGVAGTTTQVEVDAAAPVIDSSKTDVSQVIGSVQIQEMPINGRRVDTFVLMSPAVAPDGNFGLISFRGIAGHNSFLTDGNDTTNQYFNENAGRTRIQSPISQEAVQEFQVISNNFSAEYGNAMGGVVNTVTKSGTNDVHGTGYWFFRNRSLNARDRYATFNPQDKRHQAGASLGGALRKDKAFYFFNYEATRRDFPAIASVTSANLFTAAGTLDAARNPCPDPNAAIRATAAQCETAIGMLTTRNFGTVSRTVRQDLGFGKIDYQLNDRNNLSFGLSMLRWVSPHGVQSTGIVFNTGNAIGNNGDSTVRNAYGRAQWTGIITATLVNEARFGWFKDRLHDPASDDFLYPGLGRASLTVNNTQNLGVAANYPRLNPSETRFSFSDNLSWVKGAHTVKFGADIAHTEDFQSQLSNQYGSYSYSTLNAFALDFSGNSSGLKSWNTYSQRFGNPTVDTVLMTYGFYAQDQYRVNARLTLNFGLRYDYTDIPQPKIVNPDYPQTGVIHSAKDNLAPRAGLTLALDQSRKTLLRAGYGMFFARTQTGLVNTLFLNNNVYQQSITYNSATAAQLAAGPVYPNFLPSTSFTPPPGSVDIVFADPNLHSSGERRHRARTDRNYDSERIVRLEPGRAPLWRAGPERWAAGSAGHLYDSRSVGCGRGDLYDTDLSNSASGSAISPYLAHRQPRPQLLQRAGRAVEQAHGPELPGRSCLHMVTRHRFKPKHGG